MLYPFSLPTKSDKVPTGSDWIHAVALALRKGALAGLLADPVDGIFLAEYERGDIGDVLFRVACNLGLEGIVSNRLDLGYCAGRCKHWIKIKNRMHPAYSRVRDALIRRTICLE
jgi:bifunctional non-homologous end joining protein LigD